MLKSLINKSRSISNYFLKISNNFFGKIDDCEEVFYSLIEKYNLKDKIVLELGGTNRPVFKKEQVGRYIGLDIDSAFKWNNIYDEYYCNSVEDNSVVLRADIIISKYLIEHVKDNQKTFININKWLNSGGVSIHVFPLKNHPYSICTRLIGNKLAKRIIPLLRPGTEGVTGYPAYYNLCSSGEIEFFLKKLNIKYEVRYFFGAEDYFGFFFPFSIIVHLFNRIAKIFRLNFFASNVCLTIYR